MTTLTVACVQAEPAILDAKGCLAKAADLVRDAAGQGAELIVFPETFVPGYCQWAHNAPFENAAHKQAYLQLAKNSVRVPEDLDVVAHAARRARATVVLPLTERVDETPGTLYNAFAVFGPDGTYLGKHRKLVATHHERTVYASGGGDTMRAFEVDGVRLAGLGGGSHREAGPPLRFGALLCWNNFMPLARYALYRQGIQVYLAPTADDLDTWQTAMQYIARESRAFVVAPALLQRRSSFPDDFALKGDPVWEAEADWNERGGSCILAPDGKYLAGPVYEEETVLTAELDLDRVIAERQTFDPAGHYSGEHAFDFGVRGLDA